MLEIEATRCDVLIGGQLFNRPPGVTAAEWEAMWSSGAHGRLKPLRSVCIDPNRIVLNNTVVNKPSGIGVGWWLDFWESAKGLDLPRINHEAELAWARRHK